MAVDLSALLAEARDSMTVRRVFGDPIERDGVMVIPVANVMGGFGGGGGDPRSGGAGGGFGVRATPAGVYVVDHGRVRWEPALNLNAVILGGQIVAIVLFLAVRRLIGAVAEQRSTKLPPISAFGLRGESRRPWSKPLTRVLRG